MVYLLKCAPWRGGANGDSSSSLSLSPGASDSLARVLGEIWPLHCSADVVHEGGEDELDFLLWAGDHQQNALLELV